MLITGFYPTKDFKKALTFKEITDVLLYLNTLMYNILVIAQAITDIQYSKII